MVKEEGVYRLYDLQGDYQKFSLGGEAGETGITDARIHENGFVALTGSLTFLEVKGWGGGRPLSLANPGETFSLNCCLRAKFVLIRPSRTTTGLGYHPS